MCPGPSPRKSCMKKDGALNHIGSGSNMKKVFFDEVMIKEFPNILGDHPAVSSGAPIAIGWKPISESVIDLDFYEYCRVPERRTRKKMILSVRRRANNLLSAGYSLEQIANATLEVERTKKLRAESLRASGWNNPFDLLSGAVETTGAALKKVDVLSGVGNTVGTVGGAVGSAAGAVVGAGAAVTNVAGKAVGTTIRASVTGVNTVIGVGSDVTISTGKLLVSGMGTSTRAVSGVATNVAGGVATASKAVAKPVVGAGKVVAKPMGKVVTSTGRTVTAVVGTTGRALAGLISPVSAVVSPKSNQISKSDNGNNIVKRRNSLPIMTSNVAKEARDAMEDAANSSRDTTINVQ